MYEQHCAMHTLYDCFANVCRPLCTICVVLALASVYSNFNTCKGCLLKTKQKLSFDTFTLDTLIIWLNSNVGFNMLFLYCHLLYSMVYHVLGHSLSSNAILFTILLPHNIFEVALKRLMQSCMFVYNL